jgi:hypothetical protein
MPPLPLECQGRALAIRFFTGLAFFDRQMTAGTKMRPLLGRFAERRLHQGAQGARRHPTQRTQPQPVSVGRGNLIPEVRFRMNAARDSRRAAGLVEPRIWGSV